MSKNKRNYIVPLISAGAAAAGLMWSKSRTRDKQAIPSLAGYGTGIITSGSMEPTLMTGDMVLIRKKHPGQRYSAGDIVVYWNPDKDKLIIHRIARIDKNSPDGSLIICKGDANQHEDKPISMDQLKGKIIQRIPKAGRFAEFVKTPAGIASMSALMGLLMFGSEGSSKKSLKDK